MGKPLSPLHSEGDGGALGRGHHQELPPEGTPCVRIRLLETQSRSVKVKVFFLVKRGLGTNGKTSVIIIERCKEQNRNKETNQLPSVLQPKETYSLEELLVILDPIIS